MEKTISIRIDEKYEKAIEEISKAWGNTFSQSDIIRYCIYYTHKHEIKYNKKTE